MLETTVLNASYDAASNTYRLEGGDLGVLAGVGHIDVVLHVVDGHTASGAVEADVGDLLDTLEGAVLGPEVEDGSPVVGEVLSEGAGCASGLLSRVQDLGVHRDVESILISSQSMQPVVLFCSGSLTPPTIWCRWEVGATPGSTRGSRRCVTSCEHEKRMVALAGPMSARAARDDQSMLAVVVGLQLCLNRGE